MKKCFGWMVFLLFLRCILGWYLTLDFAEGEKVRITGYPIYLYQNNINCTVKISKFNFTVKDFCAKIENRKISVIGTFERRVIDSLKGEMWLRDAKIDNLGEKVIVKTFSVEFYQYLENFRNFLTNIYKKYVPEQEAGLISGVVLGYKKDIGQKFYDQMIRSGTVHIAVASGYNILLAGGTILSMLLWLIKRKWAVGGAILGMIFYALLSGGEPPVIRAVWMAGVMYIGTVLGRSGLSWWTLLITSWLMLMIDPVLIVSISFQLSIAASFGLMVLEPWLKKRIQTEPKLIEILDTLGIMTTLSTMIMTMPFLWWHFGRLSLIGIVSNILILPLVPLIMVLGVGTLIFPFLFSIPVYVIAHTAVVLISFFGS